MTNAKSIGFIMDGNRTYSKKKKLDYSIAYQKGVDKAIETINYIYNNHKEVKQIQLYTLSKENIKNRSPKELKLLYNLIIANYKRLEDLKGKNINLKFIGQFRYLRKDIINIIEKLNNKNKNAQLTVYFCVGYGGRQEIIDAINQIIRKNIKTKITDKSIRKYMYDKDLIDPDIIIRTSNQKRISGFLLYFSAYSELFFTKKLWPELTKMDINKIIKEYNNRKRNFGK